MLPEYNIILLPIIMAVMLSYNRPVTLDEITDGVQSLLSSQREKFSSVATTSLDSSIAKLKPTHRRKK